MCRLNPTLSYMILAFMLAAPLAAQETPRQSEEVYPSVPNRCTGTGIDINRNICLSDVRKWVETRHTNYLSAALKRYQFQRELAELIAASDAAFMTYKNAQCAAASKWWDQEEDKTIRVFVELNCAIRLTDQRTYEIWENWLIYYDDIPPILPEPKPYPAERTDRALW